MNGAAGPAFQLDVASLTDVGTERAHNEDRCGHLLDAQQGALLVVADGVSSAAAGETAAQTAVDATLRTFADQPPGTPTPKRLNRAAQQANIEVYDLATVVPELRGMTTTLTAVAVDAGRPGRRSRRRFAPVPAARRAPAAAHQGPHGGRRTCPPGPDEQGQGPGTPGPVAS